ncbi:ABC-type branched-chain amino acid transport system, permease component [Lachnospiraceae bacterium JC7]|nr:ABC-type branched-chain amino acid transport system, permease component [Lachnospiraceae bacterium JC7]
MKGKNTLLHQYELFVDHNKLILAIILAVIILLFPFVIGSQYLLTVSVKIGSYVILAMGLNILTGYTGLVSLGHAGFVAIGAYTTSLLTVRYNVNFFIALLAGITLAGIVGILLGMPTLRVSGTYLSIITLGFGEIIKMIAMNWNAVTNGTLGIKNIPKPSIGGFSFTVSNYGLYYLMIFFVIVVSCFCLALVRSKTGRALMAIRTDELAATMMGINVTRYKILAFSLSAIFCALGGGLYATLIGYIDPNTFNFDVSTMILSIVILGGMGTLRGMFIGAIILIALPEVSRFLMEYRFVLYGVILVVMMRFRPQGILGWRSTMPFKLSKHVQNELNDTDLIHQTHVGELAYE